MRERKLNKEYFLSNKVNVYFDESSMMLNCYIFYSSVFILGHANYFPPNFKEWFHSLEISLEYFMNFQADLNELRSSICSLLNQNADIIPVVNRLNFAQCTYLLSVFRLETLRYFQSAIHLGRHLLQIPFAKRLQFFSLS